MFKRVQQRAVGEQPAPGGLGLRRRRERQAGRGLVARDRPADHFQRVGRREGLVGGAHAPQPIRVAGEREHRVRQQRSVEDLDHLPAFVPRLFVEHGRAACRRQRARVHHLVLARQVDLRHDDGRQPERSHLAQRAGAPAHYREVGECIHLLDVVEERPRHVEALDRAALVLRVAFCESRLHVRAGIERAVAAPHAGPVDDEEPVLVQQERAERVNQRPVDRPRALRSAEREDDLPPRRHANVEGRSRRIAIALLDPAPQRIPGHRAVLGERRERIGERHEHAIGQAPHEQVQLAGRRVLLVHVHLRREQAHPPQDGSGQHRGRRGIAARADDDFRPERPHDEEGAERAGGEVEQEPEPGERGACAGIRGSPHELDRDALAGHHFRFGPAAHTDVQIGRALVAKRAPDREGRVDVARGAAAGQEDAGKRLHRVRLKGITMPVVSCRPGRGFRRFHRLCSGAHTVIVGCVTVVVSASEPVKKQYIGAGLLLCLGITVVLPGGHGRRIV